MKTVEPCGTRAAYMRHRRNGEDPCQPCIHAQSAYINQYRASQPKKVAAPKTDPNAYEVRMAAALEKDPPVIGWRKNTHGIWVHTSINDPHAETTVEAQAERLRAAALIAERDRLIAMQDEAREVAERFEQHRANNTRLMQAARTQI